MAILELAGRRWTLCAIPVCAASTKTYLGKWRVFASRDVFFTSYKKAETPMSLEIFSIKRNH